MSAKSSLRMCIPIAIGALLAACTALEPASDPELALSSQATPLVVATSVPATAATPVPPKVRVGDCFGGALANDPVHCAVIQKAHNQGLVTVDAIYSAGGDKLLYIFITENRTELDEAFPQIEQLAFEEISARMPDNRLCGNEFGIGFCRPGTLSWGIGLTILPRSTSYEDFRMRPGGAEARRSELGWGSFRQLWPAVVDDAASRWGRSASIDVTDVDTQNIPAIYCGDLSAGHDRETCPSYLFFPDLHISRWWYQNGHTYLQVKAIPGQEDEALAAARTAMAETYQVSDVEVGEYFTIATTKYDYGDYWRWNVILNRFAQSAGNSLGIVGAEIKFNHEWGAAENEFAYPVPEIGPAPLLESGALDHAELRATLWVWTLDLEATLAGLPRLLSALGIPADAVGLVVEGNWRPFAGGIVHTEESAETDQSNEVGQTPDPGPVLSDPLPQPANSIGGQVDAPVFSSA